MSEYKPIKIKRKKRLDPALLQTILYRVLPIVLVVIISVCGFSIFDKKISEIIANQKYTSLAERGTIDDPLSENYTSNNIDWLSQYSTLDPNGFDPLALSPLGVVDALRPSGSLSSTEFERSLGYTNKQSKIWSIHDSVNSDIVAWIYMYGLGINYQVASEANNINFYLNHSYDKSKSTSGTLFISSACGINPISKNLIIHGHNMRDGTMFATLANYLNGTKAYYDSHKYIFFDTLYGTYRYEIYSVYKTTPEDIYLRTGFSSNAAFLNWCDETNKKGIYKSDTTSFSASDRIITLSTCDATSKYRIIVHAKMVYPVPTDDIDSNFTSEENPNTEPNTTPSPSPDTPVQPDPTPESPYDFAAGSSYCIKLSDTKSTLRLRNGPNVSYGVVGSLAHGTQVTILADSGEWVKVKTIGGMEGYLMKKYLVPEDAFSYTIPSTTVGAPNANLITPAPAA